MKWSWLLALLLVGSYLTAHAAEPGGISFSIEPSSRAYGDISVRVEALSPGNSNHGYQEYRATVINHSSAQTHRVTLVLPNQPYNTNGNVFREIRRAVEVAPQATAVVSLFQPPLPLEGVDVRVLIDGRPQETPLPLAYGNSGILMVRGDLILVSTEISKSRTLDYAESYLRNANGTIGFSTTRNELPVTEWSTHWLGYSKYDGVILTAADWSAMPAGVRQALWRYLESGGTLLIFGGAEVPTQWQSTRSRIPYTEQAAEPRATPPPDPSATPTPTPAPLPPVNVREDLQCYAIGFGKLFVMPAQAQPMLTAAQWQLVQAAWQSAPDPLRPYYANTQFEELNTKLPVIEKLTTPVRGLFLLMLLFVIVIGPVNLLVLARRRKKLWLLWTVPAISLLTCLAIAGYAIASEGIGGHTRALSLTILDEQDHRATTIGYAGFYSPLTPSDGLHFSYDTEVTPVLPFFYYYNDRAGTPRTVDWTVEQQLTSGWVTARVPVWFQVRKNETRRERLLVTTNAKGALVVTNGLGTPIRQLWLPDQKRILHEARDIAPGAQVELKESPRPVSLETMKPPHLLLTNEWLDEFEEKPELYLAPGTYLAVLDAAPFNEPGLRNARQAKAKTLVYGIRAK